VYFNLLSLSQAWVNKGKMSWPVALWLLHGAVTLGALGVVWWRDGALINGRPLGRGALVRRGGLNGSAQAGGAA